MNNVQQKSNVYEPVRTDPINKAGLLSDELLSWIGRSSEPRTEIASRREIRKYSIATGWKKKEYLNG
jgi:hypothetical protein